MRRKHTNDPPVGVCVMASVIATTCDPRSMIESSLPSHQSDIVLASLDRGDSFIAGGSVLDCVRSAEPDVRDIDLYCKFNENARGFLVDLINASFTTHTITTSTKYGCSVDSDTSIVLIVTFSCEEFKTLQVMVCLDPLRDIFWFDFTVCSVYFDGALTHAFYPEDIASNTLRVKQFAIDRMIRGVEPQKERYIKYTVMKGFGKGANLTDKMPKVKVPPLVRLAIKMALITKFSFFPKGTTRSELIDSCLMYARIIERWERVAILRASIELLYTSFLEDEIITHRTHDTLRLIATLKPGRVFHPASFMYRSGLIGEWDGFSPDVVKRLSVPTTKLGRYLN